MGVQIEKTVAEQAKTLIDSAKNIVIHTHMAPDGDAMGSALAIYHWLNKKAHIIVPNAFPAFFNWMPGADDILIYEKDAQKYNTLIA